MTFPPGVRNGLAIALIASSLAGCAPRAPVATPAAIPTSMPAATTTPARSSEEATTEPTPSLAERYGFPTQIDPAKRYLFYLHGKIIEDQGLPATSPEFGRYHYEEILKALEQYGSIVISEQRPRDADGWEYARRGANQVLELLNAGVPPSSVTVVGASKGASIATGISYLLGNPDVSYVLLGTCHPTQIEEWKQQGVTLSGNVLAIRDSADDEYSGPCAELFDLSAGKGLTRHDELVLQLGTGHGILYQPLPEWVLPTLQWANRDG